MPPRRRLVVGPDVISSRRCRAFSGVSSSDPVDAGNTDRVLCRSVLHSCTDIENPPTIPSLLISKLWHETLPLSVDLVVICGSEVVLGTTGRVDELARIERRAEVS